MKEYLLWILVGYLSGSVLYAYWIPRQILGIDIRENTKDHNPGTANAFLNAGVYWGSLILLCELLKGMLPVYFAARALNLYTIENVSWLFAFVVAAPVIGHAYPFFGRLINGGKGIAVSFGVLLGLWRIGVWQPACILAFFYIFYSVVIVVTPHRARTVVTYFSFLVLSVLLKLDIRVLAAESVIAMVVIWKHAWWKETEDSGEETFGDRAEAGAGDGRAPESGGKMIQEDISGDSSEVIERDMAGACVRTMGRKKSGDSAGALERSTAENTESETGGVRYGIKNARIKVSFFHHGK